MVLSVTANQASLSPKHTKHYSHNVFHTSFQTEANSDCIYCIFGQDIANSLQSFHQDIQWLLWGIQNIKHLVLLNTFPIMCYIIVLMSSVLFNNGDKK